MASIEELKSVRMEKMQILKDAGMNPFTAVSKRTNTISEIISNYEENKSVTIDGRIMSIRGQGAILFANIFDGTGTYQAVFKKDELNEKLFALFTDAVDIADFIEVTGTLFKTKTEQESLLVKDWRILTKSLAPLPDKWAGLTDNEERFRKRYLDLLMDENARETFRKKALFWQNTRNFLVEKGFLEVETPTIEVTTGGAEARPFKTHHNDFDMDVFMRISVGELWQKRLLAGGFPRTFEIGRVYRNEGSSAEHVQEFTNMEFYSAYMDYKQGIEFTENMMKDVIEKTFGTLQFSIKGHDVDLSGNWKQISYVDTIKEMAGIDILSASADEMRKKLDDLHVEYDGNNVERLTDTLWKYCRKQIVGPLWLVDVPKVVSPLAKAKEDNSELTERVQLILAGAECTNGFSELNDPIDQRARFETQQKLIESGDEEAMMPEWEFVEMLEHGMPPAFGFAYGERLFAFLTDKPIREVQLFPLMKPRE